MAGITIVGDTGMVILLKRSGGDSGGDSSRGR
jgi:hypothetical protein